MQVLSRSPTLVLRFGSVVYKFVSPSDLLVEMQAAKLDASFKIFQRSCPTEPKFLFEYVPCQPGPGYIKMPFLGKPLINRTGKEKLIFSFILGFSRFFQAAGKTVCLGDLQLRNLYMNGANRVIAADLGISAGRQVEIGYNEARFLLHLIDLNRSAVALELFSSIEDQILRGKIMEQLLLRSNYVFRKRIGASRRVSAFKNLLAQRAVLLRW